MKTIEELQERVEQLEKDKRNLMNRCWVHTRGLLCIFCGFREECEHTAEKVEDPAKVEEPKKVRNRSNIFD